MTAASAASMTIHRIRRRDVYSLLLILAVAAALRMGDLARITHYNYDQATLSRLALDMVSGKRLPLLGIESSAGVPNSPATVYFLALPYLLTDNPQWVTLFIAAWNVVGVGLLWLLAHRYFAPRVAFVAGFAYAAQPFAVHYSRAIWAQDYLTTILLAGFLLALLGFVERRRWAQVLALPALVFGMQIHYAAWALLPLYLWIVWNGRRHIVGSALAASIVLSLLTLAPFIAGLAQSGAAGAAAEVADKLDSLALRDKAVMYALRLATGLGGPWVGMATVGDYSAWLAIPDAVAASWLVIGALAAFGLVAVWRDGRFRAALLWLWAVLPFVVFIPNWTGVYPHYFIPSLAAFSLSVGVGVAELFRRYPRIERIAAPILAVILATQGVLPALFLLNADARYTELFPTPMHYLIDVRGRLQDVDDVIISGGTSRESGYDVWKGLLYRSAGCVRELVIASGGVALFPAHPFAMLTPPNALEPAAGDLYATENTVSVPLREGEGVYTISYFERAPQWNGAPLTDIAPARFDNGAQLTGYRLDAERLYLAWTLDGQSERTYQYFAHFLDANGEKIGQRDASFYPGVYWCANDRLITWIDADAPEDAATLRVGMYLLEDRQFVNAAVLDAAGSPASLWLDIPLSD